MTGCEVLEEVIAAKGYVVADGAMGTQLFAAGLTAGDSPELWNTDRPLEIQEIHQRYLRAGADLVLTNSFGGNRFRLALHGLSHRVAELNEAAARNARRAADEESRRSGRPVAVAGSMGPSGELLAPMGEMTPEDCEEAFAEQAAGLEAGGADVLWIETMSDLDELRAAVRGARSVSHLPVAATMSFDTVGRTMMGVHGAEMGQQLRSLGLVAMGANCGNNLADTEAAVAAISASLGVTTVATPPTPAHSSATPANTTATNGFTTASPLTTTTNTAATSPTATAHGSVTPTATSPTATNSSTETRVSGIEPACELVIAKPNAGVPIWRGNELVYNGTPELMAAYAYRMRESGVSVIGACCGSTPAHIAKIAAVLSGDEPVPKADPLKVPRDDNTNRRPARKRHRRKG